MVSKLLDSLFYCSGVVAIGSLALFWNKRFITYDSSWIETPNYRKVINFKYGFIPENSVYEKSYDNKNWFPVSHTEYNDLKNRPNFDLDFTNFKTKIDISASNIQFK